jgi:putative NIF3 family GTP cyclohydrolase 1 type 2
MAGPLDRDVRTVAVCGGAGAFLMGDAIAAGADVFVTSDVRHHEFVEAHARGLLLIDAGHAATETSGTRELARRLQAALDDKNVTVTFVGPDGREPDDTADNSDPYTR